MNIASQTLRRRSSWHRHDSYARIPRPRPPQPGRPSPCVQLPPAPPTLRLAPRSIYRFGSFVLDLDLGALLADDRTERALRPKSFALLCLLVENAGRLVRHDAIFEALWPGTCVTENSVSQCVHDIRRALGPTDKTMLRTISRRGFLFAAQVIASTS